MGASEPAGLTAVVTSGASGIGPATVRLLAARGARLLCLSLKSDDAPAPLVRAPAGRLEHTSAPDLLHETVRRRNQR